MDVATFNRRGWTNGAPLCGHGYIPLSFREDRRYEYWANNRIPLSAKVG